MDLERTAADAGVIDQNIQPTQFPSHALNQRLRGLRFSYIGRKGSPTQFGGERSGGLLWRVLMQGDRRAFGSQGATYRLADATGCAGYQGDAAVERYAHGV